MSAPGRTLDCMITLEPKPLLSCSACQAEMRLFGIEPYGATHELYTFECIKCARLEARSVRLK